MPHPFRVFDKLDAPIWKGAVELMLCGTTLGYSVVKFLPLAFPSFSAIYFPYIVTGVIVSAIVGIVPQVWRPISYEAEKTFALTQLQVEDETKKVFKQVPLVVHQHKEEWGWRIVYHLPKGLSYRQVMGKKEYLETALRAEVDMQWDGKYLHMDIATKEVPEHIEYFIDTDRAESPGVIVEGLDTDAPPIDSRGDGERKEQLPPPDNCDFGEV
jgi:hypothetical protein